jgi:hypothetical protein
MSPKGSKFDPITICHVNICGVGFKRFLEVGELLLNWIFVLHQTRQITLPLSLLFLHRAPKSGNALTLAIDGHTDS